MFENITTSGKVLIGLIVTGIVILIIGIILTTTT